MIVSKLAMAAAAAALLWGTGGCSAVVGDQQIDTIFRVDPNADGKFWGWSEVTIDQDPSSVDGATIGWVTLYAEEPANADLTFIKTVSGEAVTPEERTLLASKSDFPPEEPEVPLDLVYDGDIRGFFQPDAGEHTIRIEWTGSIDPAFDAWPEEGFKIRVTALIQID